MVKADFIRGLQVQHLRKVDKYKELLSELGDRFAEQAGRIHAHYQQIFSDEKKPIEVSHQVLNEILNFNTNSKLVYLIQLGEEIELLRTELEYMK